MKFNPFIIACALMISATAQADHIPNIDCMIEPNATVELSSPVAGVLNTLTVDRSDKVKKGEIIATLKADVEMVSVKTSEERLKLINIENTRAIELYREKAITLSDKDKSDSEKILSELELKNAKANLDMRHIKSPFDGVVVKRYFNPGEFVENKPIVRLAELNPLKIEVVSPISNYGKIVKGMKAKILPEFGNYENLIAEVVIVDKVIDAASGTFGIRLELANEDYTIPGGLKCKVQFMLETAREEKADNQEVTAIQAMVASILPGSETSSLESDVLTIGSISNKPEESGHEHEASNHEHEVSNREPEASICSTIGPYKKQATINNFIKELETKIIKSSLRTELETVTNYHIRSDVFDTLEQAKAQMKAMKAANIVDMALINDQSNYRISLGLYSHKSIANERLNALLAKGYQASMKPMERVSKMYWADIIYLPQSNDAMNAVISGSHRSACSEAVKKGLLE